MKTQPFLRDIDSPTLFADRLENVYLLQYEFLGEVLATFPLLQASDVCDDWFRDDGSMADCYEKLARMRYTMSRHIRDMAERKKRLADLAVGLAEIKLDEERG